MQITLPSSKVLDIRSLEWTALTSTSNQAICTGFDRCIISDTIECNSLDELIEVLGYRESIEALLALDAEACKLCAADADEVANERRWASKL